MVHNIFALPALESALNRPWSGFAQQTELTHGMVTYLAPWGRRTKEWDKAVTNVARYVAAANLPYHITETGPFLHFMRAFLPQWPEISKQTITRAVEREAASIIDSTKKEMREVLKSTKVSMTADIWTSRHQDAYLTATLHWIDDQWCMKKRILGKCRSLPL
jgi:glucosamine 6-phosphate synthetase-like amidotransferase/phosphosugar isomerase protein